MESERSREEAGRVNGETKGYEKRGGFATTTGQEYEVALCSLFFLRALRTCRDFYLACNHNLAGDFDDVVLFYRLKGDPGREYSAILLQAKHKDKVTEKRLTGSYPFRFSGYLNSFRSIRNLWEQPLTVDDRQITLKDVNIVLYSNTGCNSGDAAFDVTGLPEVQQLQNIVNTGGRLLRIPKAQKVGLPEEPDTSEFLGQLLLCVNQMSVTTADQLLQKELCRVLTLTSTDFAGQLTSELKSVVKTWWSDDGRGRYLTPDCEEWKKITTTVNGNSDLVMAAEEGDSEVVQFLLDKGFDVNLKNNNEDSALTSAAYYGHLEVVKLLLENKCDVNTKNKYGNNAFTIAACEGHLELVKLLIEGGAETNIKDAKGDSALTLAAHKGHSKVVQFLLDKGFDVNLKNNNKYSAVMLAACNGHLDVVKLLLENGCDVRCKNKNGDTALTLAVSKGHREIENLLRQK